MRTALPFVVVVLTLASLPGRAPAAKVLRHYDTDSLCDQARLIVRVQVGRDTAWRTADGDCTVHEVKILATLKGEATPGITLKVAGLDLFYRAPGMAGAADSWAPVGSGDVVYLFLVRKGTPVGYNMYDLTDAGWKVIESGARLEIAGRVYAFGQDFNMGRAWSDDDCRLSGGPYAQFVAMTDRTFPNSLVERTADFERHLADSIRFAANFRRKLDSKTLTAVERKSILDGRPKTMRTERAKDDYIAASLGVYPPEIEQFVHGTSATRPAATRP